MLPTALDGPRPSRLVSQLLDLEGQSGWCPVSAPQDVTAFVLHNYRFKHTNETYPVCRCTTNLKCSAEALFKYLVQDITTTLPKWSRDIETCEELARLSTSERILLVRTHAPLLYSLCVAPREDLFYVHADQGQLIEVSEFEPDFHYPIAKGAVRSQMHFASKRIVPVVENTGYTSCRYEVMWSYDAKGAISSWLPRWVSFKMVHDHMKNECERLINVWSHQTEDSMDQLDP